MLGPEEEGKINWVTVLEISPKATGMKTTEEEDAKTGEMKSVTTPLIKIFLDVLGQNKPKKGKKGGKAKKGKKKK